MINIIIEPLLEIINHVIYHFGEFNCFAVLPLTVNNAEHAPEYLRNVSCPEIQPVKTF